MMGRMPWWAWVWPLLAWGVLVAIFVGGVGGAVVVAAEAVVLVATVFAAVWHAEVVAHRVGEPFGTLVLALAVTVIEVALIVSVMLGGKAGSEALARDTVLATVMIILNGLVGLCLLLGGVLHREQEFQAKGGSAALAVLAALVTLSLVPAQFHHHRGRAGLQPVTAGLRRHGLAGALRRLYLRADRAASRLLPAGPGDGSGQGRGGARAATVRRCGAR
jgi:Ca2+:H+ antiporter